MSRSFGALASRSVVTPNTRLYSRSEGRKPPCIRSSWSRSTLSASAHWMASSIRGRMVTPSSCTLRGSSGRGSADPDFRAQLGQAPDVAAGHAAVEDVAADGDLEPLDPLEPVAQGEHVEQALGRVLVLAVAGVDDVASGSAGRGTGPRPRRRGGSPPCRSASPRGCGRCPPGSRPCSPRSPAAATFTVSALSRFSANSNEIRVRVEASKKRLTMVLPRSAGTFLIGRSLTSLNGSAVSRMSWICSRAQRLQADQVLAEARRRSCHPAPARPRRGRRARRRGRPPGRPGRRSTVVPTMSAWIGSSRPPRSIRTQSRIRRGRPKSAHSSSAARTVRPV